MPDSAAALTGAIAITDCRALLPDGFADGVTVVLRGDRIEAVGTNAVGADRTIEGRGMTVFPGLVDVHGDAFEREVAPRPGLHFPVEMAIAANDANLIAHGITCFFYSITDGFEPGLRSRETARDLVQAIEAARGRLRCDSRIHIRHEQAATEGHDELIGWIADNRVDLVSLNDHLMPDGDPIHVTRAREAVARRTGLDGEALGRFIDDCIARHASGGEQIEELAAATHAAGVALASHDERTTEEAARAARLGVRICEFPLNADCAVAARARGADVVMGAPNLVRGGSHCGGTSVRDEIAAGRVSVLCSDYHYPSLLRAPFLTAGLGLLPLEKAWDLVSRNPAEAVGLGNRKGRIAAGMDADLVGICGSGGGDPTGLSGDVALVVAGGAIALSR